MQVQIKTTPQLNTLIRNIERLSENLTDGFDWESLAPTVAEAADNIFASEGRGQWPTAQRGVCADGKRETIRARGSWS